MILQSASDECRVTYGTTVSAGTTAASAATATTATATASSTAATTLSALSVTVGSFGLLTSGLGLASELDRHLALEDLLAGELLNGTLGLGGGREVDESVADGTLGAGVLGDGDRLARGQELVRVMNEDDAPQVVVRWHHRSCKQTMLKRDSGLAIMARG